MENILIQNMLPNGIALSPLNFLVPDEEDYSLMCLQHGGNIEANENYVINQYNQIVEGKIKQLLIKANAIQPDLLLTPEYSTPWTSISNLINNNFFPEPHKMWVLGCESIQPEELEEFKQAHNEVKWICEDIGTNLVAGKNFIDPALILFNCENETGDRVKYICVQFKGIPSGGNHIENNYLITGNHRYIFSNNNQPIKCAVLICSDVRMGNFSEELLDFQQSPYLVIHLQLCLNPFHDEMRMYRDNIYAYQNSSDKEIICINWAPGFTIISDEASKYGGSCYYTKSEKLCLEDRRINTNHNKGLYYTYNKSKHTSNYYFNYKESIFLLRTKKCFQLNALGASAGRTGPELLQVYEWSDENEEWLVIEKLDDGFENECDTVNPDLYTSLFAQLSALDQERLISVTTTDIPTGGNITADNWYKPNKLKSFCITANETIKRKNVTQHPCNEQREHRISLLTHFNILYNTILNNDDYYPNNIKDMRSYSSIKYPVNNEYLINLVSDDHNRKATVAYIGNLAKEAAQRRFDTLYNILPKDTDQRRLVVWYTSPNNTIEPLWYKDSNTINNIPPKSGTEIDREK